MASVVQESSLPMDKYSVLIRLVRDLGVPILMLVVVSFALWQVASWIGANVLLPTLEDNKQLVSAQVEANKAMLASMQTITANIESQTRLNAENSAALQAMAADLQLIRVNTGRAAEELPKISDALTDLKKQ
jgi:hypothetical protein